MATYDILIKKLENIQTGELRDDCWQAAESIRYLQTIIRHYNPDDSIFDNENTQVTSRG